MKIEIELNEDQIDELVRRSLIESYKNAETFGGFNSSITGPLDKVIEYYSDPYQYQEFLESK